MEYKEFSAKTVEEAVTKALLEFGTTSEHVEYEVVEKGSAGLLGFIGSRPAVIRARVKENIEELMEEEIFPEKKEEKKAKEPQKTEKTEPSVSVQVPAETEASSPVTETAKKFLSDMFRAMGMEVTVTCHYDEGENVLDIDLAGKDMGILIGKRGQTLDSLQYLVSLAVNKKRENYIRVKLDTENYRERRKETLETLAKNIASKVKRTKRPVSLEPMNPYERRVIHAALQNDKYVLTRSEGEEPYRHVVIFLKRERYHKS